MSVLINKDMPSGCFVCDYRDGTVCCGNGLKSKNPVPNYGEGQRPEWCPLSPVSTPHGRLIDADGMMKKIDEHPPHETITVSEISNMVFFQPTVISAEEVGA